MLLGIAVCVAGLGLDLFAFLLGEVLEELALEIGQVAIVVLQNLGRQIVEHLFLQATQQER